VTPVLYSIDCPKCKVLQKKLSDARIQYAYCTDKEKMVYMGITSLPMLLVNDVLLDFSEALDWIEEHGQEDVKGADNDGDSGEVEA
jgi:hypothetical protein